MTTFGITRLALGPQPFIEIDEGRFRAACESKRRFIVAVGLEEKLDLLLENYAELEGELLFLASRYSIFSDKTWSGFMGDSRVISRRISNLLSSARLYIDHVQHDLKAIFDDRPDLLDVMSTGLHSAYDDSFAFRLLEALRNHIQHRSIPIRGIAYPSRWDRRREPPAFETRMEVLLDTNLLLDDKKVKALVREEVKELANDRVDLVPMVREYVGLIGGVHERLREAIGTHIAECEANLVALLEEAREPFGGDMTGLGVVARRPDGTYAESQQIFRSVIEYRRLLVKKNSSLGSLSKRHVSGAIVFGDEP